MVDEEDKKAGLYRISDILRGAQKMVIVVGSPSTAFYPYYKPNPTDTDTLLRQWGSRMWTFPEVLLSPNNAIPVYNRDKPASPPLTITKNQFAGHVWASSDANISRQLIDHFTGTLSLSGLEPAVLLLKCLFVRDTQTYFQGDHSYALMGLPRLRPLIDQTDSAFQAFACNSLATTWTVSSSARFPSCPCRNTSPSTTSPTNTGRSCGISRPRARSPPYVMGTR